jgi:molybdopterin-guanine dinucleotide biosynthesis protein A
MMGSVKKKITCGGRPMTAIALAGGRSRRMRADKAGLAVGDLTLLEHVLGQLEPYFEEILVSVSPGQTIGLEARYEAGTRVRGKRTAIRRSLKPRVVEDETPDQGPLGGILAGLKAAANEACAVVACDIPDIDIPLLRSLARAAGNVDIAVPVGPAGHFEPLFAVYRKPVVPEIEALLRNGERSILPLFGRCRTVVVRLDDAAWLRNLNTREDYRSYLRTLTERQTCRTKEGPRVIGRINRKKRTDSALSKKR